MLPLLLAVAAGGLIAKQMTDYPSEIRNLRKQMPKEEREDFIRDYKQLPNETKTQFKQYLREANLVEAGKLIGKDLTGYNVKAKEKKEPRIPSAEISYNLFAEGMSVYQIASERGLAQSTILSHLAPYCQSGKVSITALISQDKIDKVKEFMAHRDNHSLGLADIKKGLNDTLTYDEIKLSLK